MEWTLALKAHYESAWLGHFGGVVFDQIHSIQGFADFYWGYLTFEHALDCVGAVENSGHGLIILCEKLENLPRRLKATKAQSSVS